jgi:F0F1-type ATP synthase assembly protein I
MTLSLTFATGVVVGLLIGIMVGAVLLVLFIASEARFR